MLPAVKRANVYYALPLLALTLGVVRYVELLPAPMYLQTVMYSSLLAVAFTPLLDVALNCAAWHIPLSVHDYFNLLIYFCHI